MRYYLLAFWTGVRLPASPFTGMYWLRQGVIGDAVDAGSCLNANNIVSFSRTAVAA